MALFVGDLAFEEGGLLDQAKIGVLSASVLAAALGLALARPIRVGCPFKPLGWRVAAWLYDTL
jgi:Na+/H+ antiporter 1